MDGQKEAWEKTTISPVRIDTLKSPIYRSRPRPAHIKEERSSNNKYRKEGGKIRTEREREANPAE